ncbi:MAG: 50S ribosomal protein L21e [Candidatus Freyrarchaeum guaymaensis]|nr:50S ribosomal protein L21e [Candidatus Sigynarchaeota archaeon]
MLMKKSKGYRSRTRKLLKKHVRERGLPPLSRILRVYEPGEKVSIVIDPSIHKGQPHKRFHGKIGTVVGKRGRAYVVSVKLGNSVKTLISRPEHLRPIE